MVRCSSTLPNAGPNVRARRLLVERSAGRAQAQAQRGIGGVGLFKHQQMMRRSAHIADRGQRSRAHLPLDARHPVLRVGRHVVRIDGGNADQRLKLAPVHAGVRIRAAGAVGHVLQGEALPGIGARCGHGKRRSEQRRRGRGVGVPVGRIRAHDARRQSLVGRVIHAVAEADAGGSRRADDLVQKAAARSAEGE